MTPKGRRRILVGTLTAGLALAYGAWVLPTGTILDLHASEQALRAQLATVRADNARLTHEIAVVGTVAYQEHLAEQEDGMVPRGTVAVQVLPSSPLYRPVDPAPPHRSTSATSTSRRHD